MHIDTNRVPGIMTKLRAVPCAFDNRSGCSINLVTGDAGANGGDGGELCLKHRLIHAIERMVLRLLAVSGDKECPRHVRTIPLVLGAKIECDHLAGGNHFVRGFTVW
ncbi:hypothetical protein D3C71_1237820 [compost metagenome]